MKHVLYADGPMEGRQEMVPSAMCSVRAFTWNGQLQTCVYEFTGIVINGLEIWTIGGQRYEPLY